MRKTSFFALAADAVSINITIPPIVALCLSARRALVALAGDAFLIVITFPRLLEFLSGDKSNGEEEEGDGLDRFHGLEESQ